jgi:hypothetical protein
MDRLRRWLSRRPTGRAAVRRAGVTALAVLIVTAALALLLAVLFHLAWPPVVVAILGTLPALYVAWLAVPGAFSGAKKSAYARLAGRWDPVKLGVHRVIGGGPMPTYIRRPHDELLRAVLDPAVAASRLVVIRGGSSTGKTRAAYEAVADRLANWQLDYPRNPDALAARLDAGIPARTVLWLGELRQYVDADRGAAVLGRLADLLEGEGSLVITTMWPEHWNAYTAAARAGRGAADPADTAGRLLNPLPELTGRDPARIDPAHGGVIDVPDWFITADLEAVARTGDSVLGEAAAAAASAGQEGQVTQYLAGVPDLLDRYARPGGDPYGQAVITAAMDATRLGHASPLPAALVQEAAVGYLTDAQRIEDIAIWRDTALAWAAEELNGAVRALQPIPPAAGTGVVGYQVADYLDQHGRRTRQDQLGPASLWDALTAHTTDVGDLTRLGQAARDRGLYRHTATLWTTAAALDSADAASRLIGHLCGVSPGDTTRAARWAVSHVSLDEPWDVARLLEALREAGAEEAVRALATRAAGHASLDHPVAGAWLLLKALHEAGAEEAVRALATRAAGHASLGYPATVAWLRELRAAGASDAVRALLDRDPAGHASLDHPGSVIELLWALRDAGADEAVHTLAIRAADHISLDDPQAIAKLLWALRGVGADEPVRALAARATNVSLDDLWGLAKLLGTLHEVGADDTIHAILACDPIDLHDPRAVAVLLGELRGAGADDAVHALLARDPAGHASLDDPGDVALLLEDLCAVGADEAFHTLAIRAADHASLDDPQAVVQLLDELLYHAGASDVAYTLAMRAASNGSLADPQAVAKLLRVLREIGAEEGVHALLGRDPAGHVSIDHPRGLGELLQELRGVGAEDTARTLAARAASHAILDDAGTVFWLLRALRGPGVDDAVPILLARDPAGHISLDGPVGWLLKQLHAAGAEDAARTLAARAANAGQFGLFLEDHPDEVSNYPFGREPDGAPSQSWKWQEPQATTAVYG